MSNEIALDASQVEALHMAAMEPLSIITGGPGTGKTTILRHALLECERNGESVALCAPTGKAAKRMSEATGREAKTIHRLLGYSPVEGFLYNAQCPLPYGVVFADEASMIDVELFAHLLAAIDPNKSRLVLVGDSNQLPSVGPGRILADLVSSELVPCARLTHVHRSAEKSWICRNAPRILEGEEIDRARREDFRFVEVEAPGNVGKFCGDMLEEYGDAQILIPQRTGAAGTDAVNVAMQARFNPLQPGEVSWSASKSSELRPRDRVIHTVNNYELGVFNGEIGTVSSIDNKSLSVEFADRGMPVVYTRDDAKALQLAYALTIHKSQGSEWQWVIVVCHSTHTFMLTRQLLYTAITRGKAGVILVGNRKGLDAALKSKRDSKRNTALCDRIRGEL